MKENAVFQSLHQNVDCEGLSQREGLHQSIKVSSERFQTVKTWGAKVKQNRGGNADIKSFQLLKLCIISDSALLRN